MSRVAGPVLIAVAVAATLLAVAGCTKTVKSRATGEIVDIDAQKYDYETVKRRAGRLKPGMRKIDVLIALGSPAEQGPTVWTYKPEHEGLILPAEVLQVRFDHGVYVEHTFRPVLLGEPLGP